MAVPNSIVTVCSGVRLDSRYEHTIFFKRASDQEDYFAEKVARTFSAYTYLRKSWSIKVAASMEDAATWNYLFFTNDHYGKTYYYFINQIEYVNDNTVELFLELDVMQTYMFDYKLLDCFVERQHTETDEVGEHTVDEGLELGELYCNRRSNYDLDDLCIMVMSTINPMAQSEAQAVPALPYMYNGVFSGVKIWAIDSADWVEWGEQLDTLLDIGQSEAIVAMWMYPKEMVILGGEDTWGNDNIAHVVEGAVNDKRNVTWSVAPDDYRDTLAGYEPKNNKLHTYPYQFISMTNNQGGNAVYRYELFDGLDDCGFALSGSLSPDGGVRITPIGYNGVTYNYEAGLSLTGFPTCAWNSDIYKLWLAQNQNSQFMNLATGAAKIVGGVAGGIASLLLPDAGVLGGIGIGTAISGAHQISDALAQKADRDIIPPQARGNFSASVNITNGYHCFSLYEKCVNAERARIIDDYFTMYGYKLNRVMKPVRDARPAFTYIKTIGCHIEGELCNEDIVKIESIYDKGITFWMDGDHIADYSQDNTVYVG